MVLARSFGPVTARTSYMRPVELSPALVPLRWAPSSFLNSEEFELPPRALPGGRILPGET